MSKRITLSLQTRANWLIDLTVLLGGLLASLSGIYFMFLPSSGYQGGRNPMYGVTILFDRHSWDDLHTWAGVAMIVAAVIHFAIHWQWVKMITKRTVNSMLAKGSGLSRGATLNVVVDATVAISFLLTAISGLYFFIWPSEGASISPVVLFTSTTWDLIHTWVGVLMISAIVIHFWIHWRWVTNVTGRFFRSLWQRPDLTKSPASA